MITLMIAVTLSCVMGFQQTTKISSFQRSSDLYRSLENKVIKKNGVRLGSTSLCMGKLRNKQAELQRKMMLAKQQNAQKAKENGDDSKVRMTDEELKEANDRKRFDELLNSSSAMIGEKSSDSYLTQEQEEENIDAYRKFFSVAEYKSFVTDLDFIAYCFSFIFCRNHGNQAREWIDFLREIQRPRRLSKN